MLRCPGLCRVKSRSSSSDSSILRPGSLRDPGYNAEMDPSKAREKIPDEMPAFEDIDRNKDGLITRAEYEVFYGRAASNFKDEGGEEDLQARRALPLDSQQAARNLRQDSVDILQFDAGIYFVEEEEQVMNIDVIRLGSMKGECRVKYKTVDASAIAGQRYEHVEGELTFADKDTFKTIQVPIIDSDQWSTTLEFKIMLSDPVGCELGRYLYMSRVKVIDRDYFPTNRFNAYIDEKGLENLTKGDGSVKPSDLLIEYFKLNYSVRQVKWKTWATAIVDQLQNAYFLLTVNLLKYVADDVLALESDPTQFLVAGSRDGTLYLVGALYLVPYGILNGLDVWKAQLGLAEESKAYLRENMFRKFMNYDEESRGKVSSSDRVLAMTTAADDIVDSGYMKVLEIAKSVGKLGVSSLFILQENPEGREAIVIFALAIAGFVIANGDENVRIQKAKSQWEGAIVTTVQDSTMNFRLIADYFMRPRVQDWLEQSVRRLTRASIPVSTLEVTNSYFPGWLANFLTAAYIVYGGQQVATGDLQIGAFLGTSGVIKNLGSSFTDIFTSLLSMSKAVEPIEDVTVLMNLPTDLRQQKKINRLRRKTTKEERSPERLAELRRRTGIRFATDAIPIQIKGVQFAYPGSEKPEVKEFDLSVPQGKLVAVVGPRREGKSTVMRLLGMVVTPSQGEIFVPAHLRILHVSQRPILLNTSPWENLAIGRQYWKDSEFESLRAIAICKRLGIRPGIVKHLEETREEFLERGTTKPPSNAWMKRLSSIDAALIHVGRAFIYNPEVLVIHRPTLLLPMRSADVVLEMMSEFVDQRGIELPVDNTGRRRPRTLFASFARTRGLELADVVWGVKEGVVSEIAKSDVSELLLQ